MQNEQLHRKYGDTRHWDRHPTAYAESFANYLGTLDGLLLDLGCGSGRDVNVFHQRGLNVIGIDHSPQEIAAARARYPDLRFHIGNIEALSYPDESVAALYAINLIHYVDQVKALGEGHRVLCKGGNFFTHFNLRIVDDRSGKVDYQQDEAEIMQLVDSFEIRHTHRFERVDRDPFVHTHDILELILQKP